MKAPDQKEYAGDDDERDDEHGETDHPPDAQAQQRAEQQRKELDLEVEPAPAPPP